MKCRSCQSAMVLSRSESSDRATTSWHQCPLCKQVRLTSERDEPIDAYRQIAKQHSDDDSRYPAELDTQPGMPYLIT